MASTVASIATPAVASKAESAPKPASTAAKKSQGKSKATEAKPPSPKSVVPAPSTTPSAASPKSSAGGPQPDQEGHITTLVSSALWDVYTLPPSNSFKGKVVPRAVNKFSKRRKVCIIVQKITPTLTAKPKNSKGRKAPSPEEMSYEECFVRVLHPATKEMDTEARKAAANVRKKIREGMNPEDVKAQKMAAAAGWEADDESTIGGATAQQNGILADGEDVTVEGWVPKFKIPIRNLTIRHHHKKSVFVIIEMGKLRQEREILFDTHELAQDFVDTFQQNLKREEDRANQRLKSALGDIKLKPDERLTLLVEIVSGWDLPIGDLKTSDPYVICKLGRKELHRTKHIAGTLDPIWTIKTDSLFLWQIEAKELFLSEGMQLLVKDYDALGKNETLGLVVVPPVDIYNGKGERVSYKLQGVPGSKKKEVPGYLAVRIRRATEYDKKFMADLERNERSLQAPKQPESKSSTIKSIVTRREKKEDGITKFKVRPKPDPKDPAGTEWLTDEEIQKMCMQESRHWTNAGSGNLGQLFVEVLGCDGLPNLDTGGFLGNKTDCFVSLVFEDCYVRTDTIDDCLSPRWLPWSHRAFIFQIFHSSSQLMLGVFDADSGLDDHDLIGRVSVDVASLRRNTEYVLTYNIFPSARVTGRDAQGQVTIRVRLEAEEERKMLLSALEPPPPVYVNTKKKRDFRVIRNTCIGKYDYEQYSVKTIKSYVDELREYQYALFYLQDAAMALLLWRGHLEVTIGSKKVMLPLHSFNAFICATTLVEYPQLIPSFFFFSIAWLLIAVMGTRRRTKNVWGRCKSFSELLQALVLGNSTAPAETIEPFQDFEDAKTEMELWIKRIKDSEKEAEQAYLEAQKEEQERLQEQEEIGDDNVDISTSVGGKISIDPIRAALFPVQQLLGLVCRKLRFVRNIVIWEECYFAFWITTGCLVLSIACMFVPWFWIIKWVSRIVVWVVFGPWMKALDVYYVSKIKPETEEDKERRKAQEKLKRKLATTELASIARQKREDAKKLKQMKKYMFGKFSMKIPVLKEDRYMDRPLPQSTATPYTVKKLSLAELAMQEAGYNRTRLPGQHLVGDMIPTIETQTFTTAPIGKATAHPEYLSSDAPGGGQKKGSDTTASAYMKIGGAVAAASAIAWVAVPAIANVIQSAA